LNERDPPHADYKGIPQQTGSRALIFLWVHEDGMLGSNANIINLANLVDIAGCQRGQIRF